ncbi:thioredoxin domain-containing protein [Archangium lipolyticum]|uniref:hypothetical protein n=1 Tax=Archangium lipolyticum TaxID=2970465 RepID=UPI00214A1AC0|nr:hypothetical protein [Archangium lipolyticum]
MKFYELSYGVYPRRVSIYLAEKGLTGIVRISLRADSSHTPRKSGNIIDLYTTFPWKALCAEVVKLKVQRHERGQFARLPLAASAEKEDPGSPDGARSLATSLATASRKAESFPGIPEWRRRESNPPPLVSKARFVRRGPGHP